jgi:hypothetical protein
MNRKKVFKTKTFDRWVKKIISDKVLCVAASEIERGLFEADLGSGVCKKRVAIPGQGKSGSTRMLVVKQHPMAIVFLVGREKSAPGADFSDPVVEAVKTLALALQSQSIEQLYRAAINGELTEICNDKEEQ